jgi:5-methylthioadenosine/S-adenosylhomocysteine deaminase
VFAAHAAHVKIALAPDWSPTGSDGLLAELNYASAWNEVQKPRPFTDNDLVNMATRIPAELIGASDRIGALLPGHDADLLVLRPETDPTRHDAWWTATHATAAQVMLVTVHGQAVYGDAAMLIKGEQVEVCGVSKVLLFTWAHGNVDAADETWASTTATLTTALRHYGRNLAPLAECGQ